MKKILRVLVPAAFLLFAADFVQAATKTYQVTGPVLEVSDSMIAVQKGKDRWEIARDASTKVTGDLKVGSKVTFVNNGMAAQHTITFGPELPNIFAPYGDPTSFTGQQLNSGIMVPGSTFKVTFNKAGTFTYICGLHDYLGMVGTVRVTD